MKKIYLLFATVILFSCQQTTEKEVSVKSVSIEPTSLVEKAQTEPMEAEVIVIQGVIDVPPNERISIQPHFEGFVADIQVIEGEKVSKGDLLFKLINPDFIAIQEDFLVDKANVDYLERMMKRTQNLHNQKVTAEQDFQEVEMNYKVAKANLQAATKTLKMMGISIETLLEGEMVESISFYSPISGFISELPITGGQFIQKGTAVLGLINTDHIHLELNVFERELSHFKIGQTIQFKIPDMSGQLHEAEIVQIRRSIDPQTRMALIHAHPKKKHRGLYPGMFVEAEVEIIK